METNTTNMLACVAVLLLAAAGCDRQGSAEQSKAETPEKPKKEARGQAAGDQNGDQEKEGDKESGPPKTLEELPEGVNVLQHEMQLLNTAMRNTLTLIANDSLQGIPAQIKKVHPARQLTKEALEKGKYEPPVNADDMETFAQLDARFHQDLKAMIKAAKNDDLEKTTDKYTDLIDGCTNCHTQFRFK